MATTHAPASPPEECVPPSVPHTLLGIAGEDSIALSWQQDGPVDFWTVYVDPLDGSDTAIYRTQRPRCEITDLAAGDHEIGVMAWRDSVPCPGPGTFLTVSVLGAPTGGPPVPDIDELTATPTAVSAEWRSDETVIAWDARLVATDWTVEQRVEGVTSPSVSFSDLCPDTVYGVQVRARSRDGRCSPWSPAGWQRTGKDACRRRHRRLSSSAETPNPL